MPVDRVRSRARRAAAHPGRGTARAGRRGTRPRAGRRPRRRSRRRGAPPARRRPQASSWRTNSGSRERDSLVFTRVSGTTTIGASGSSVAIRSTRWRSPLLPDQADAAGERCGEVVGVAFERQAELEHVLERGVAARRRRARRRAPRRPWPPTIRARARAGSGSRTGSGGPRAAPRARTRGARGARRRAGSRRSLRPRRVTSGSPTSAGATWSSFQRSSAAPAQSNPGPRLADVAAPAPRN